MDFMLRLESTRAIPTSSIPIQFAGWMNVESYLRAMCDKRKAFLEVLINPALMDGDGQTFSFHYCNAAQLDKNCKKGFAFLIN